MSSNVVSDVTRLHVFEEVGTIPGCNPGRVRKPSLPSFLLRPKSGVCELLGFQVLLRDLGLPMSFPVFYRLIGCTRRGYVQGIGKINTSKRRPCGPRINLTGWIVKINMISGVNNLADLMTEEISGDCVKTLMHHMSMTEYSGRHRLAPLVQGYHACSIFSRTLLRST